jgi:hypothetical protein
MKSELKSKAIFLESGSEWEHSIFKGITVSSSYLVLEYAACMRVIIGFQKPNDSNWWAVESDSVWVPDWVREKLSRSKLLKTRPPRWPFSLS